MTADGTGARPLAAGELGAPASAAPTAVLLHGFTQNRHCWGPFAGAIALTHRTIGLDLPGHGDSGHDEVSFEGAVDLVTETLTTLGEVDLLVGYSMGGRMALRCLIEAPEAAAHLVLIGATAGLSDAGDRAERQATDRRLAGRLQSGTPEDFLDFWLALPLFYGLTDAQQCRAERLAHWGSGVGETLLHRGTGSMEPLWDRLDQVRVPTLILAGSRDEKFADIGARLASGIGAAATLRLVEGSGHACHLEDPALTAAVIASWRSTVT